MDINTPHAAKHCISLLNITPQLVLLDLVNFRSNSTTLSLHLLLFLIAPEFAGEEILLKQKISTWCEKVTEQFNSLQHSKY